MRILDTAAARGEEEEEWMAEEGEGGEGTSGARTRALNEILRGTEVALRLASPSPPRSLRRPLDSRSSARGRGRAPPMGGADGRREVGALDQWGAPAWAGPAAGESPLLRPMQHEITRDEILRCSAAPRGRRSAEC